MAEIRCDSCGWLNEPGARMCGGCGRPLPVHAASMGSGMHMHQYRNPGDYRGAEDDDARTVTDVQPLAAPQARPSRSSGRSPQPEWSAAPEWPPARRGRAGKVFLGLLIGMLVLLLGAVGVWAAIVRPQLHEQIDGAVRSQLGTMVATVNRQPLVPSMTETYTAAQVTQSLSQQMPAGIPIQNVQVTFTGGRVVVTFTTDGFDESVSTQFIARNGRLAAVATEVDGPIALVESGSEMETALNDALSGLRTDVTIQNVTLDKNVMSVKIKGNIPGQ